MKKLLLLLLFYPSISMADIYFGIGLSKFGKEVDGMWYQNEFPHNLNLTVPSAKIGWENEDYRVGYIYTGKVTSNALAKSSDLAYTRKTPWPLSQWYGTGKSEGFSFERKIKISQAFYGTLGAMVYRSTWDVVVPDYYPTLNHPVDTQYGAPFPVYVQGKPKWAILPMATFGVTNGTNALELAFLPTRNYDKGSAPIYRNYAVNISVLHKFK